MARATCPRKGATDQLSGPTSSGRILSRLRSVPARAAAILLATIVCAAGCDSPAEIPVEVPIGLEVGLRAPSLTGTFPDGGSFDLAEVDGVSVLVFYRSAECGLCRLQLDNTQQHLTAYDIKGVAIMGVTLDPPETSQRLIESSGIGYPLVSVDRVVFEAWGALPEGGDAPLPATYIVDDGLIRFRHIGRNASDRTTDAGVLTVIESLEG